MLQRRFGPVLWYNANKKEWTLHVGNGNLRGGGHMADLDLMGILLNILLKRILKKGGGFI
jgi:hypothetical protein